MYHKTTLIILFQSGFHYSVVFLYHLVVKISQFKMQQQLCALFID